MELASRGALGPGLAQFPSGSALVGLITLPVVLASALVSGIIRLLFSRKKPTTNDVIDVIYERP